MSAGMGVCVLTPNTTPNLIPLTIISMVMPDRIASMLIVHTNPPTAPHITQHCTKRSPKKK